MKGHAYEVTVKFFAMKLEILVLSWKSEKIKMKCKPKVIVLLYCYTCHGASIHIFPQGMKLKCQIFMIVR